MNRRAFLTTLGGAISAIAARPVMALVPLEQPLHFKYYSATISFSEVELANAIAFATVGALNPPHRNHYRARALAALARYREAQQ